MEGHKVIQPELEEIKATDNTTILIVEDDPLQVEFLEQGLSKQGFRVLSTTTCDGAFRLAKSERPDVILLDILLPDGDGMALCRRLSDHPQTVGIPIIILSGSDREDLVWETRHSGGEYFLKKPFDPNALLILIDKSLDQLKDWS